MGTRRNVIMLNGNRYDATTGELLDTSSQTSKASSNTQSRNIDGFVKKTARATKKPNTISRQTARSKTLMRTAVSKPKPTKITDDVTIGKEKIKTPSLHNPIREQRALETKRSQLISRFGGEVKKLTKYSPLPIANPPEKSHPTSTQPHATKKVAKIPPTLQGSQPKSTTFESALQSANGHQTKKLKKETKRHKIAKRLKISPSILNVSASVLVVLVLGGYFAYNNVPNLAMRVASTRSGIQGSLPAYSPSGFSMNGPIKYQAGQIAVNFGSNSDDRNYTVTERNSEWNSEALLENHVAVNKRAYQTFQEKGKTIYIYDGSNASWVDSGIWYEVNGNSSLSTDQVLRIANSL